MLTQDVLWHLLNNILTVLFMPNGAFRSGKPQAWHIACFEVHALCTFSESSFHTLSQYFDSLVAYNVHHPVDQQMRTHLCSYSVRWSYWQKRLTWS